MVIRPDPECTTGECWLNLYVKTRNASGIAAKSAAWLDSVLISTVPQVMGLFLLLKPCCSMLTEDLVLNYGSEFDMAFDFARMLSEPAKKVKVGMEKYFQKVWQMSFLHFFAPDRL